MRGLRGGEGMTTATRTFTATAPLPDRLSGTDRQSAVDRWIYVITAAGYAVVTLVGFIPDSVTKIGMVQTGQRPPFAPILHVHAVLMAAFLLLLLLQTILAATGRTRLHRRLGLAGMVLAPAILVSGVLLVPTTYHWMWASAQAAAPQVRAGLEQGLLGLENVMLAQIRFGILFPLAMVIGLRARAADPGLHKRMMILAIAPSLSASFDRIAWLPTTLPASLAGSELYILSSITPMLVWDLIRNRSVHRAYWIWLAAVAPLTIALHALWDRPWWHATARRLMGL
jgi:hypothetical protein